MTFTLHHLEESQSFRILWLLEELGMVYELKLYERTPELLAPPEYKAISSLGTSPTITDGTTTLCESNAILDYILDKATKDNRDMKNLRPTLESPERTDYLFWFHCPPASMQFVMTTDSLFQTIPKRAPWPISWLLDMVAGKVRANLLDPRLTAILQLAEKQLKKADYLAGGNYLTAADVSAIYSFESAWSRNIDFAATYPACDAWLRRVRARPAFQSALTKSGSDSVALPIGK